MGQQTSNFVLGQHAGYAPLGRWAVDAVHPRQIHGQKGLNLRHTHGARVLHLPATACRLFDAHEF